MAKLSLSSCPWNDNLMGWYLYNWRPKPFLSFVSVAQGRGSNFGTTEGHYFSKVPCDCPCSKTASRHGTTALPTYLKRSGQSGLFGHAEAQDRVALCEANSGCNGHLWKPLYVVSWTAAKSRQRKLSMKRNHRLSTLHRRYRMYAK